VYQPYPSRSSAQGGVLCWQLLVTSRKLVWLNNLASVEMNLLVACSATCWPGSVRPSVSGLRGRRTCASPFRRVLFRVHQRLHQFGRCERRCCHLEFALQVQYFIFADYLCLLMSVYVYLCPCKEPPFILPFESNCSVKHPNQQPTPKLPILDCTKLRSQLATFVTMDNKCTSSCLEKDPSNLEAWLGPGYQSQNPRSNESGCFVEITRLPKKIEPKTLTSMIATGSKIVPKQTEICCKDESLEKVALVEFKTPVDAYRAVDRMRASHFGKNWRMKFITDPKFADPEREMVEKWLR
jgi:hypothetical protein